MNASLKKGTKAAVVIVSADLDSISGITKEFEADNYEVTVVKDGSKAVSVDALKPNMWRPSLYLIDLVMPSASGYVVCQQVLSKYSDGKTGVILMAQHIAAEDKLEASQTGAMALIPKPVTLAAIREVIEKEKMRRMKTEIGETAFKIGYE